jgi:hypothetical protein
MADAERDPRESAFDEIRDRLAEAARTGRPLALILSVSGKVWPVAGKQGGRWRMRTGRGHVFTFRPEFVIAFEGNGNGHALRAPERVPRRRARIPHEGDGVTPPAEQSAEG